MKIDGTRVQGVAFFVVVFSIYLTTVCPTVPAGDSGELITVSHTFGVAHPPGYPLFTLLGALADRAIPFGEPAYRVNLVSAFFGALSAMLIFLCVVRLGGSRGAGILGACVFAFSPVVWLYSSVAEVFSLNTALNLAATLAILPLFRPERLDGGRVRRAGFLVGLFLGLGMSNHHTTVLVGASFGLVVLFAVVFDPEFRRVSRGFLGFGILGFVSGLAPYVYLPLAARGQPPLNWDDPRSLSGFFTLITRADYGSFQLVSDELATEKLAWSAHLKVFGIQLFRNTLGVGLGLGILSVLGFGFRRSAGQGRRRGLALVFLAFGLTSFLFLSLVNSPLDNPIFLGVVERFYILPLAFFAVLAGLGFDRCIGFLRQPTKPVVPVLIAVVWGAVLVGAHYRDVDQSDNYVTRDYGKNLLEGLDPGALLFSRSDLASNALCYQLYVLGERPDVIVVDQEKLTYPWYHADRRRRHPTLALPGVRYDGLETTNLDLIRANEDAFPIYFFDFKERSFEREYIDEPVGLLRRIVAKERISSTEDLHRVNSHLFSKFLTRGWNRSWEEKTFEREAMAKYSDFLFNLGWEAAEVGRVEEAESRYQEAALLNPKDWRIARNLGILLVDRLHRDREGADFLEESLRLHPKDPTRGQVEKKIQFHRMRAGSSEGTR